MAVDQDRIKLEVFGRTDNLPPPGSDGGTGDAVNQANDRVNMIRKWYADATGLSETTGADSSLQPDVRWQELVELEAIAILIRRFRSPQDSAIYKQNHIAPLMQEIAATYSADWTSEFGASTTITPGSLRKSVISSLIRKKDPVFPPLSEVDNAIQSIFDLLEEEYPEL